MALKTKYITLDDVQSYGGVDLVTELGTTEAATAFLTRIETRLESFLDARMHQSVERRFPELTDYQKRQYKLALIEQAIYVWKNGETAVDSGYDPSEGLKATEGTLIGLTVCREAKQHLIQAGLWTYKLRPYGSEGWIVW